MNAIEWVEVTELPNIGWITITEIGEENVYFTFADGRRGFWKYLG